MLTDQPPLRLDLSRSLCRAIHHQTNIDTIDLSRNCLEDDGFRHLVDALETIRPKTLKVSGNHITSVGLAYLVKKITAVPATAVPALHCLADLQVLDLGYNPLGDAASPYLHTLIDHCPALRSLILTTVGLRQLDGASRLIGLTELDVAHNEFSATAVRKLLQQLNACKIVKLRLGHCVDRDRSTGESCAKSLAEFLQTGTLDALRVLDVSGWQLDDSDVYEVVQTLRRASGLDELWATENAHLGAIGFAQLVRSVRVKRLYLDGCAAVLRHLAGEQRSAMAADAGGSVECGWVRLPKYSSAQELDVVRAFWTHIHGARATVTVSKTKTVLDVLQH